MSSTRRSLLAACTAGIGALAGCTSTEKPTVDGDWPRRTLTNAHTGYATTDGPTTDLHTVWTRDHANYHRATSPVVEDGTLYLAYSQSGEGTWIEAFDAATGDSRWTTELFRTDEAFRHLDSLVVDDDRLFVQTKPGLTMLTTDGEVQWTFDNLYQYPGAGFGPHAHTVTPVVTDDLVVTGTYSTDQNGQDEVVYGIDPVTGEERWRTTFPEWNPMGQLAAADDVVYVPFLGEGIAALDLATGTERWRWKSRVHGSPTVADDLLLVPRYHDSENLADVLVALDRSDRSIRWQQPVGYRWPDNQFTVAGGRIYHTASSGVEARRLETGERIWHFGADRDGPVNDPLDEPVFRTTPIVSGDAVYAAGWIQRDTMYGHLFVVDAATGEELGRGEMGRNERASGATPAVTSDLVFLASSWSHQNLYAFGECSFEVAGRCLRG